MQRYSLAFLTVFDVTPEDAIGIAAEAGYDMVGFRILPSGSEPDYPLFTDDNQLARVQTLLQETGIKVGDVEIIRLKETNDWDLFSRFLERCAALEARHILVAGDDSNPNRLTESFAKFCDLALPYGLTADLEFMPWTEVPDLKAAHAIVSGADRKNGGVLIDALHMDRSDTTIEDIRSLPSDMINYVQFCDGIVPYDPSTESLIHIARNERLFPGMGGIDLAGLARSIPEDVTISVEVPHRVFAEKLDALGRATIALEATKSVIRKARKTV